MLAWLNRKLVELQERQQRRNAAKAREIRGELERLKGHAGQFDTRLNRWTKYRSK